MITAAGVLIAGAFAYFKFIKGRTLHPRCSIAIDSQLVTIRGSRGLRVSVTARNEGQVALLVLYNAPQRLLISQADSTVWKQACERRQAVQWEESEIQLTKCGLAISEGELLDPPDEVQEPQDPPWWRWLSRRWLLQLLDGDKLEPGEQWARSALVPVEPDSVAYLLRTEVSACRHVALRHVISHRLRCCNTKDEEDEEDEEDKKDKKDSKSSYLTWSREVYVLAEESKHNGHWPTFKTAGKIWRRTKKNNPLP